MKSMKIRKLAALGVAAAVAAMPVAFAAAHYDTLPKNRDWYLQSKIVVGADAIASDVVAAADIAAAVAALAYKKAEVSGGVQDATVKLKVSGQIVVGDNGYAPEDGVKMEFGEPDAGPIAVGPTEAPKLFKHMDLEYSYYDGADTKTETVTMDEGVQFTADFENYKDSEAKEAYPVMEVDNVVYGIQFAPGIKTGLDRDNNELQLVIPIFGKDYIVSEIGKDGSITFIAAGEDKTLDVGQEVEFEGHTVKLLDISEDGKAAKISVDGVVDTIEVGRTKTINGVKIYVKNVFNGVISDSATLSLGAEEKTYNNGDQWNDMDNWQIEIDTDANVNYITGIKIKYVGSALTGEDALKEGDKFQIADSDLYIEFYGHDDYAQKEISFDGDSVKVPFYAMGTVDLEYYKKVAQPDVGGTAIVDLGDVAFKVKKVDANTLQVVAYKVPGMSDYEDVTGDSVIVTTGGESFDVNGANEVVSINIDRDTLKKYEIEYNVATDGNYMEFTFLAAESNSDYIVSKDRPVNVVTVDKEIRIDTDANEYIAVPVDFAADELNVDDLGVTYNYGAGSENYKPDDYKEFYTEEFDKVELSDTSVKIYMGVKPAHAYPWVGVPGGEGEKENVYIVKPGKSVSIGDYEVTIEDISGVVSGGEYYEKVASFDPIGFAVLDNEASSSDNLIVVGGWNANKIAAKIKEAYPEIEQELAQDKEIIGLYTVDGQEVVLVAGWEAQDTRKAAADFIKWLQQNIQ